MPKVSCPHCYSSAVRVGLIDGYKFYCSHCGWNHEVVRRELSSTIVVSLVLVTLDVVLAIVVRIKNPGESWGWALLLAFAGLPIYYAFLAYLNLRKLGQVSFQPVIDPARAVMISEMSASGATSKTTVFEGKEFPELVKL